MHELRVVSRIVQTVAEEMERTGLSHVDGVKVRIGELSGVDPAALWFGWSAYVRGSSLEHVALDIERVAVAGCCRDCHREFGVADLVFRCPHCGSAKIKLVRGQEIEIASLTIHEPDPE